MNNVDKQYLDILKDIIDNGVWKNTRSGNVKSVFGRTMRFNLSEGLPLLTTKKVFTKGIIYELLWFLKGDTNIKYLVDNNVHIWDDDAFRWFKTLDFKYLEREEPYYDEEDNKTHIGVHGYYKLDYCIFDLEDDIENLYTIVLNDDIQNEISVTTEDLKNTTKEQFIDYVKKNAWIHRYDIYQGRKVSDKKIYQFGDLGEIYGKQWRNYGISGKDQIANIINTLKTNPDDRRMVLNAWNPDVLDNIALPACHMFATFWTRELTYQERFNILLEKNNNDEIIVANKIGELCGDDNANFDNNSLKDKFNKLLEKENIPTRELSCSFTMRSNDFCCGNPYNICQYAFLTYMFCEICNMKPGELIYIGNDVHIYENHIEQAEEQISRKGSDIIPKLSFKRKINDINDFTYEDFVISDYHPDAPIKYPLNVG